MIRRALIVCVSACVLVGCVTEGPAPAPRQKIRTIPQPPGLEPATIVLSAYPFPEDTDGNGFGDSFSVTVFLFPPENRHPMPIHASGTFEFSLATEDGEQIASWELDRERVENARVRPLPGPGYEFLLNINEVADDRVRVRTALLRCTFIDSEGDRLDVRGPATLTLGALAGR